MQGLFKDLNIRDSIVKWLVVLVMSYILFLNEQSDRFAGEI